MKKLFITLITILSVSLTAMADSYDSCVVKNGNGASVVVTVEDFTANGTVYVSIASDCDDYVNVTYEISLYHYSTGFYQCVARDTFTVSVQPNSNTPKKHEIKFKGFYEIAKADVSVSGARCE